VQSFLIEIFKSCAFTVQTTVKAKIWRLL